MKSRVLSLLVLLGLVAACALQTTQTPTPLANPPTSSPLPEPTATIVMAEPTPAATLPPVSWPEPSYRAAVFYYPWYRNLEVNGQWIHWEESKFRPPDDISSDYYPILGAYSSVDPAVVAQHFAWLRQAGVGVIISSWWGQGSREDQEVPILLKTGEQYGIKIAFHIEPYRGRTAQRLVDDIQYIANRYGSHPAFYRTIATTRWNPGNHPKGLYFVWLIERPDSESEPVESVYWQEALDAIHALPDGALVIANTTNSSWVDGGHFDGLYNYATLHLDDSSGFTWAKEIPPDSWYVPGIIPGFSARRIGYSNDTFVPRKDGETYNQQWQAALDAGVEPAMVTITSFNEWHEGTQIEPAREGVKNGDSTYADYRPLSPDAYLTLTRQWIEQFLAKSWPATYRIRIKIITSSDWTTFGLVDGGAWIRPALVSASEEATYAWLENGRFLLTQPITRSESGGYVQMVVDVLVTETNGNEDIKFAIERGHLGATQVEVMNYMGDEPVTVSNLSWAGINPDMRNTHIFQVPSALLLTSTR